MPVGATTWFTDARAGAPHALAACTLAICFTTAGSLPAQQQEPVPKKIKKRSLYWNPPDVNAPVLSAKSDPPCLLGNVLEQAGTRASELSADLQKFTAQEEIAYQSTNRDGFVEYGGSATFEYVVTFQHAPGEPTVSENRSRIRGSDLSPSDVLDRGLPEIALMFLPDMQRDYEMKCEGVSEWQGQHTWVIRFQQRRDRPSRTFSFYVGSEVLPARLQGHAWIGADSGQVVHFETSLIPGIPAAKVRNWYLTVDYAPVQFRIPHVQLWLPQAADSYYDFGNHRSMISHNFSDFMLFSIQTDEKIGKPKQP